MNSTFAQQNTNMSNEDNSLRPRKLSFRVISEFVMGGLYIVLGGFVLFAKKFGTIELSGIVLYAIFGLLLLYGSFRIYRGYAALKNSRNDEDE